MPDNSTVKTVAGEQNVGQGAGICTMEYVKLLVVSVVQLVEERARVPVFVLQVTDPVEPTRT